MRREGREDDEEDEMEFCGRDSEELEDNSVGGKGNTRSEKKNKEEGCV